MYVFFIKFLFFLILVIYGGGVNNVCIFVIECCVECVYYCVFNIVVEVRVYIVI